MLRICWAPCSITEEERDMSFYDYTVPAADGSEISMKAYEGKVVLVVNTATGCGFTPQYEPIEDMYEKYHDQGLEVLDIPCN